MSNKATYILVFSLGAAIGAVASWALLKKKYEQITQEEINSVRKRFAEESADFNNEMSDEYMLKPSKEQYESLTKAYSAPTVDKDVDMIHVIAPEELGEIDDYDVKSLYYYEDGVLVTTDDEVVEDVAGTVGFDSLTHFGEYEDDSVCVRNDYLCVDFEILKDSRKYSDIRPDRTEE